MLTAAKSSLTFLMKSCRQKHSEENNWWRNVNQDITKNSPSNILYFFVNFNVIFKIIRDPDDHFCRNSFELRMILQNI